MTNIQIQTTTVGSTNAQLCTIMTYDVFLTIWFDSTVCKVIGATLS